MIVCDTSRLFEAIYLDFSRPACETHAGVVTASFQLCDLIAASGVYLRVRLSRQQPDLDPPVLRGASIGFQAGVVTLLPLVTSSFGPTIAASAPESTR